MYNYSAQMEKNVYVNAMFCGRMKAGRLPRSAINWVARENWRKPGFKNAAQAFQFEKIPIKVGNCAIRRMTVWSVL
ncbi:MAG: hypothetical protein ACFCUN_05825 [Hyphomicrobiaceae bacterium]